MFNKSGLQAIIDAFPKTLEILNISENLINDPGAYLICDKLFNDRTVVQDNRGEENKNEE